VEALLALAAGDALAGTSPTVFDGGGTDEMRGSGEAERLVGLGEDVAGLDAQDRIAPGCETLYSG
jgi:hypothetical protein